MAGQMKELAATAIGEAIREGDVVKLKTLFKVKDAPFHKDRKGNTYLHYACTVYKPRIIHVILATGLDINLQNKYGNTALHVTALQNECWHVSDLMAWGIDHNIKNWEGKTAAQVQHKNKYWKTIYEKYLPGIFEAVENRDGDKIRELISYWTKVDCTRNGQTLRQFAAQLKYHDIVKIIDEYKDTLDLIYGVYELNYEKVHEALNKTRCNVNFLNKAGLKQHILQHVIDMKDQYFINLLFKSDIDINILVSINDYYKGPLYFEAVNKNLAEDMTWTVLKSTGIDFTLKDEKGRNILIYSIDQCQISVPLFQYFIKYGASISDRDETGCNVRDVARLARRKDIVEFIDKYYIKLIRDSDLCKLRRLLMDGYDSLMIHHNYRDSFIYASGNETDEVLQFIENLPNIQKQIEKIQKEIQQNGNLPEIEELFQASSDISSYLINAKDKGGRSAVTLAVLYKRLDILRYILDHPDADINSQDNCKRTAFHYACCTEIHFRDDFVTLLKEKGINTDIPDHLENTGEEYLKKDMTDWIEEKRKKEYGMELELICIDAYEDLRNIIKHKNYGITEFRKKLKTIHVPVAAFSILLGPVVQDYKDLLFLAVDYNKPDIAKRLVDLGTDLSRKEKYLVKNTESDGNSERIEKWMTASERAEYLNLDGLHTQLDYSLTHQQLGLITTLDNGHYGQIVGRLSSKIHQITTSDDVLIL